jgi:hypothetical protein
VEVRLLEALPHALAEPLGIGREASGFGLTASVVREFTFLALERQQSSRAGPPGQSRRGLCA